MTGTRMSAALMEMLLRTLREATAARLAACAEPDAVTADLVERLRRLDRMLAAPGTPTPPDPVD